MKTKTITLEEALKNGNSTTNQEIKGKFVGREIYCNVGSLVEYCLNKGAEDSDSPVNLDEIENYYSYPEWQQTVIGEKLWFEGGTEEDKEKFLEEFERLEEESVELLEKEEISEETHERNLELIQEAKEMFEEIGSEPQDIMEWWAVSGWLYDKLQEKGQPVVDAGSCKVWGRTATGQAILLDYVITQICAEMGILQGQENSWGEINTEAANQ